MSWRSIYDALYALKMEIKTRINNLIHSKTVRNGGLFSAFSFFNKGIGFVLLILLAKYIQPSEYGELSLFNTLVSLLGYFVGLSTAGYLDVSFFKEKREDFKKDFTSICVITLLVSSFICLIFVAFHAYLSSWLKLDVRFIFLGLAVAVMSVFINLNLSYLRVTEKISKYGLLSCGYAILNFILSLYLVIHEGLNWLGRVYAQFFCEVSFFSIAIIFFLKLRLFSISLEWERYKKILIWGIPLIPHQMSVWLRQGCDQYIINSFYTTADVGVFSFALNLTNVIIILGMAFNSTNSVTLFQTLSLDIPNAVKKQKLKKQEKAILFLYIFFTIAIIVGAFLLVPVVLPKYASCLSYFLILSFYGFIQCLYFLVCNYLYYYNETKSLMMITFLCSLLHLALSFIFTRFSLYLTCSIYIISFSLIFFLVWKKSRMLIKANLSDEE